MASVKLCEFVYPDGTQCEEIPTHKVISSNFTFEMCRKHAYSRKWHKQDPNVVVEELSSELQNGNVDANDQKSV